MSTLVARIAKLVPRTKRIRPLPGLATAYSYEPEIAEAQELGVLSIVIEVLVPNRPAQAVIDLVIETVGDQYYNWEPERPVPTLERFERAIKATNAILTKHVNDGNAGWIGRMSSVVALVSGSELHLTQTGSAEAFLYRGNVTSHITDGGSSKPGQHTSTFGTIASGAVQQGDRLLIATPTMFHQLSRADLKEMITDNSATAAVRKLSEVITHNEEADRVAAVVIEMTTPELLALQTRSNEPEVAAVGQADNALDIAKAAALPAARKLSDVSKQVGRKVADETQSKVLPRLKATGSVATEKLRRDIKTSAGRRRLAIAAAVIVIGLAAVLGWQQHQQGGQTQLKAYATAYTDYTHGQDAQANGDKATARTDYNQAKTSLETLAKQVQLDSFNSELAHKSHPESDPASVTALLQSISDRLDELDNLVRLDATVLTDLSQFKNAKPTQLELVGTKLIMVDSANDSAIYSYDTVTKSLAQVSKPEGLGTIVATTPSSSGDGIYILTAEPNVWFMKALDSSLTKQAISFGNWPKGNAIASYAGNLYILASEAGIVTKHIRTSAGFAAGSDYFGDPSVVSGASAMTVDGSVYLAGGSQGLRRYLSGKLSAKAADIPPSLASPSKLASLADVDVLLSLDLTSHRVGIFSNLASSITLAHQITLKIGDPTAVAADSKGKTLYAVAGGKLVTASLPQ
jgi:hypothetical protein